MQQRVSLQDILEARKLKTQTSRKMRKNASNDKLIKEDSGTMYKQKSEISVNVIDDVDGD